MFSLLDQLNSQQREAVEYGEGPLLILAGAGSGKTRVITYRIAYLIEARGVAPENILAVTFTNKAAGQMKERVAALLSQAHRHPQVSTFHSFCVRVLRRDIYRLGYTRDFSIYDEDDQQRLIKACASQLGMSEEVQSPRTALARIGYAKSRGVTPQELYRRAADSATERLTLLYDLYESKLRQANALDFDDLLLKAVDLFYAEPDVCNWYNQRFRYLLVDEYQDTNRIQYQLIRQLTRAHRNLCVVGDEDQSIYSWRGADIQNILSFEIDYPDTKIIRLERNYRSTQVILDAAIAVVSHNQARKGKKLWTERRSGPRVAVFEAADANEEARFVAGQVTGVLAADGEEKLGVLYRTNAQSRLLEEALKQERISYRLVGGFSFYARAEIKDVLAYARLANNLRDSASFLRIVNIPPRGIGETTLGVLEAASRLRNLSFWEALEEALSKREGLSPRALRSLEAFQGVMRELLADRNRLSIAEFFKSILDRTGYLRVLEAETSPESESRIENLMELINAAAEAEERSESLAEFLDRAALVSDADDYDERARVTLMTLHCAKGLEFSKVYLVGLEEGLFPHKLSFQDEAGIEEERRLFYVGMTRAQDRLILSWAGHRRSYGYESRIPTKPSRFLKEVPEALVERLDVTGSPLKSRKSWKNAINSAKQVERFLYERGFASNQRPGSQSLSFAAPRVQGRWKLGTQVRHPKYGLGTVVGCEGSGEETKLTISFASYGRKKLVERYAALEKA